MCRPCSEALESTRTALGEITGRLREDEYNIHSFPSDLQMSFKVMAEMARMMHGAVVNWTSPYYKSLNIIRITVPYNAQALLVSRLFSEDSIDVS
jgi:hypothetical protein